MSTATIAAPSGLNGQNAFTARLAEQVGRTSVRAAMREGYTKASGFVRSILSRLHLNSLYSWAKARVTPVLSFAVSLVKTAGPVSLSLYALTTHTGRNLVFNTLPSLAYRIAMIPVRFVGRMSSKVLNRCGAKGRALAIAVPKYLTKAEQLVAGVGNTMHCWLADRHSSGWMTALRVFTFITIVVRLTQRFVPIPWVRGLIYLGMLFIPTSRTTGSTGTETESVGGVALDVVLGSPFDKPDAPITAAETSVVDLPPATNRAERRDRDFGRTRPAAGRPVTQ